MVVHENNAIVFVLRNNARIVKQKKKKLLIQVELVDTRPNTKYDKQILNK